MSKFPLVRVHHPRAYDIVDSPVSVSGIGAAFEGVIGVASIRDANGNFIGSKSFGGHIGMGFSNFEFTIPITGTPVGGALVTLEIEPDDPSGNGVARIVVPVALGNALIPAYAGFGVHTVVAGDTLGKIAKQAYGSNTAAFRKRIVDANKDVILNPNLIVVGMELRVPMTF
jgi:nucleoid-associated protein YgaU